MTNAEGSNALLERLRREERATWGVDPDGIAYLDAAERIELVRAQYRAQLAVEERTVVGEDARAVLGVVAELL